MEHSRSEYIALWMAGIYGSQDSWPGQPMTIKEARRDLERMKKHPWQYMDPPPGITPCEYAAAWNREYMKAVEQVKKERQ